MSEHRYEGRGDKSRLPDYGEKSGLLTETNTGTERTKLLATVAEASGWTNELYGCSKISRPPGARNPDPVPRQLRRNGGTLRAVNE
jgi:hypothetical protein